VRLEDVSIHVMIMSDTSDRDLRSAFVAAIGKGWRLCSERLGKSDH
jgi:hypothetical protein